MLAAFLDDVGNGLRRCGNHHQFDRVLDFGNRCVGTLPLHFGDTGIDRIERTLKPALQHVVKNDLADRIDAIACAKNSYGFR